MPVVGPLEAGDHAQQRGLARSRRPEHREELALGDLEIDAVGRDDVAEALANAGEPDCVDQRTGAPWSSRRLLHCAPWPGLRDETYGTSSSPSRIVPHRVRSFEIRRVMRPTARHAIQRTPSAVRLNRSIYCRSAARCAAHSEEEDPPAARSASGGARHLMAEIFDGPASSLISTPWRSSAQEFVFAPEELPCAGDAFEVVGAERFEGHRLAGDRDDDRPGHARSTPRAGLRHGSARDVYREARDVVSTTVDVADVYADTDVEVFGRRGRGGLRQRRARQTPAEGEHARTPSPVVLMTEPPERPTIVRTAASWRSSTDFQPLSPSAAACSVEPTRSVKSTTAMRRCGGGSRRSPTTNAAISATSASTSPTNGKWSDPSNSTTVAFGIRSRARANTSAGTKTLSRRWSTSVGEETSSRRASRGCSAHHRFPDARSRRRARTHSSRACKPVPKTGPRFGSVRPR